MSVPNPTPVGYEGNSSHLYYLPACHLHLPQRVKGSFFVSNILREYYPEKFRRKGNSYHATELSQGEGQLRSEVMLGWSGLKKKSQGASERKSQGASENRNGENWFGRKEAFWMIMGFHLDWTVGLTGHWRKFPEVQQLYLEQFRGMFLPRGRGLDQMTCCSLLWHLSSPPLLTTVPRRYNYR